MLVNTDIVKASILNLKRNWRNVSPLGGNFAPIRSLVTSVYAAVAIPPAIGIAAGASTPDTSFHSDFNDLDIRITTDSPGF